jgi:hypothetical protein
MAYKGFQTQDFMENKNCSICNQEVYSELGKGCKLCGMPLEKNQKDFCCKTCGVKYRNIHRHDKKNI